MDRMIVSGRTRPLTMWKNGLGKMRRPLHGDTEY
jgi:hypothetical protein